MSRRSHTPHAFDLVGANASHEDRPVLTSALLTLGAATIGALAWEAHPVLGALGTIAIVDNAYALHRNERTWKHSVQDLGRHAAATAGSLALSTHPSFGRFSAAIGYFGAAVAANLLIDGRGGGLFERFASRVGLDEPETIDVVSVKPATSHTRR